MNSDIINKNPFKTKIQNFDLFQQPFTYNFSPEKNINKTFFGGLLSLIISITSIAYFVYLCSLYYGNLIQPTTSYLQQSSSSEFAMDFSSRFYSIQIFLSNGQTLSDYQKESGKVLIQMKAVSVYINDDSGQTLQTSCELQQCEDDELIGRYCISYEEQKQQNSTLTVKYKPKHFQQDKVSLTFYLCTQESVAQGQLCETDETVRRQLIGLMSYVDLQISISQFNPSTKQIEQSFRNEQFSFDQNLAFFSKIIAKKSDTTIIDGFILQQSRQETYFSDYRRVDQYVTLATLQQQQDYSKQTLGNISISLGQNNDAYQIQYCQFPQLLAQFISVFNSLLVFGFLSKRIAKTEMFQEFISIYLKIYYKKTALELIERKDSSKKNFDSPFSLFSYLQKIDFRNNMTFYLNLGWFKKQHQYQFQLSSYFLKLKNRYKLLKRQVKENPKENSSSQEENILRKLVEQTYKTLDIFEVQKDLIQIKMMLKLLFTVEQYAAIQLCGSKIPFQLSSMRLADNSEKYITDKKDESQKNLKGDDKKMELANLSIDQEIQKNTQSSPPSRLQSDAVILVEKKLMDDEYKLLSHLEKIDQVDFDQNFFKQKVESFISNKMNSAQFTELDRRILECMIGQNIIQDEVIQK